MSLSGQWVGKYSGSNSGTLVIEIDDFGDHYEGSAWAWDDNPQQPSSLVRFGTTSKADSHKLNNLPNLALDSAGSILPQSVLQQLAANDFVFPQTVNAEIELQGTDLSVKCTTPVGTAGGGTPVASKTRGGDKSNINPLPIKTWNQFKTFVNRLERKRFVFRGQEDSRWRLRTSFYRTGRSNLERYFIQDVSALQKALSALTRYPFNLNDPFHYGAFLNLAQHHGYPTPLLDWTWSPWSPYVAAFFAFRNLPNNPATRGGRVRVFKFDVFEWNKLPRYNRAIPAMPHVSVLDALAFDNLRAIPQQSISTISNVDDI
jgi:FRG domain